MCIKLCITTPTYQNQTWKSSFNDTRRLPRPCFPLKRCPRMAERSDCDRQMTLCDIAHSLSTLEGKQTRMLVRLWKSSWSSVTGSNSACWVDTDSVNKACKFGEDGGFRNMMLWVNPGGDYITCLLTVTDMPLSKVINAPVHPHICKYTHLCERFLCHK